MLGDSNARENGRFEQSYDTEYTWNSGGEKFCMYFEDSGSHLGSDNDICPYIMLQHFPEIVWDIKNYCYIHSKHI